MPTTWARPAWAWFGRSITPKGSSRARRPTRARTCLRASRSGRSRSRTSCRSRPSRLLLDPRQRALLVERAHGEDPVVDLRVHRELAQRELAGRLALELTHGVVGRQEMAGLAVHPG